MRCTQFMGLSDGAGRFLRENQKYTAVKCNCPHCASEHVQKPCEVDYDEAHSVGMFDDGPDLTRYELKDGSFVYEYVQAVPWSSGPMIFLALSRNPKNEPPAPIEETLWKDEEMH